MEGSSGTPVQASQTAWRWLSTRSRFARSSSGGRTSPCTIALGSRKKYWSCGLCGGAVGEHERGLAAAAGATAALRVVGRRGRHVAQVDGVERRDVDAELHRRASRRGPAGSGSASPSSRRCFSSAASSSRSFVAEAEALLADLRASRRRPARCARAPRSRRAGARARAAGRARFA